MYETARAIMEERLREAEARRLVAELVREGPSRLLSVRMVLADGLRRLADVLAASQSAHVPRPTLSPQPAREWRHGQGSRRFDRHRVGTAHRR